uniref:Uncharacterized protein n=1 Tax=Avena sativa TaxID=4498 RepID=A0ACD5Y0S8_AVESA
MSVARCGGSGTGAHLTAQRLKAAWSDRGAGRTSLCPCSYPHRLSAPASRPSISYPRRLSASASRPLRCSAVPSPDMEEWSMEEWSVTKKRRNEEWEILKVEVARMFQPLVRNLSKISALRSPYDLEDYQIGMFFGAFLGCVGCYQLWKTAPSTFVDVALALLMYKLNCILGAASTPQVKQLDHPAEIWYHSCHGFEGYQEKLSPPGCY